MADISTKMSVSGIGQYKSAMAQAQQSVRTLDAELKKNEAAYKASGDKEQYMANKSRILEDKMKAQRDAVRQAEKALKTMADQGVNPASTAYQKMQQALYNAQTGVLDTSTSLEQLTTSEANAAAGADHLTTSVNGISKKMSLDSVIGGIDKLTAGLEAAAMKAVDVGRAIVEEILEKAQWADDVATQASVLDMGIEEYQRYKNLFDTWADITVADWAKAKRRVQQAMYDPTADQIDVMAALGITTTEQIGTGKYGAVEVAKDWETVFWDAATELERRVANGSMTQDQADVYANALFGKSFANLKPLIKMGREAFDKAVSEEFGEAVVDEKTVEDMATLNDTVADLKKKFEALEVTVLGGLAPALTEAAEAMSGLLGNILEYLKTEEGQKMLEDLGTAVSGLFEDLGNIDPEKVVEGFTGVFNTVVENLQWLVENKDTLSDVLTAIVTGWGAAKLTSGALQILNLINGLKWLKGSGGGSGGGGGDGGTGGGGGVMAFVKTGIKTLVKDALPAFALDAAVVYAASLPAIIANDADWNKAEEDRNRQLSAAGEDPQTANAMWLARAANALGLQRDENGNIMTGALGQKLWGNMAETERMLMDLSSRQNLELAQLRNTVMAFGPTTSAGYNTWEELQRFWGGEEMDPQRVVALAESVTAAFEKELTAENAPKIPVEPDVNTDAAQEQLNGAGLTVPVRAQIGWGDFGGTGGGGTNRLMTHANGLPFVPWDGYIAMLHRGERVLTAGQNASYTYNSNTYFGSVNLNNGLEVEALTDSIDRHNRKTQAGYGY